MVLLLGFRGAALVLVDDVEHAAYFNEVEEIVGTVHNLALAPQRSENRAPEKAADIGRERYRAVAGVGLSASSSFFNRLKKGPVVNSSASLRSM